ncbi:MAG: PSD1 and planctomycete cytochrome C domain-containing protein [Planctomycetaceae bacterium]
MTIRRCLILGIGCVAVLGAMSVADVDERARREFFEAKIRPVLVKQCYGCHSADAAKAGKLKGGLQLDTREGVLKGGESGAVVISGKPAESLLIQSLRHLGDAPEMPPNEKLPETVIADFEEWVRLGLPDPRAGSIAAVKRGMSVDEGRKWWSLIPPRRSEPPAVKRGDWPRKNLDRFVLAKLEEHNLAPVGDADRTTLIRRVYFDLIGLPPAPDKVETFLNDTSGEAFAKVVDELLASPRFGERWGRHWLDAARYADSNGRDRNVLWYHAWRYRDYVIAAFNSDKPFDQFLREQVAGDLLALNASQRTDSPTGVDELRIATGFLALGSKAFEELKPEIFRMDVIDEQIEVIGRSILGLSVGCARCHDHKFDPIPTRDYYALAGILRSTQPLYGHGPRGIKATLHNHSPLMAVGPDAETLGPSGLAYFERLNELNLTQNTARSDRYRVVRRVADAQNQIKVAGADTIKLQADIDRMEAEIKDWDVTVKAAESEFQAAMDASPPQPGWAMGARDREQPEDCRVHIRGETTNLGDAVPRGALQVLPNALGEMPAASSGRLQLAEWLTSRDNPLTARVFVNRVWLHLFGRGLVTTPDDFGVNGSRPSHPELLDDLSVRFMDEGWSVKTLIRELVLSRTYQLASHPNATGLQRDPENVWLWRMSPRRLEVESLRDAILTVSGQLDVRPPTPEQSFLSKLHPHREAEFFNFKPPFKPSDVEHQYRSVYLPIVRGVLPTMFPLFDFATPDRPVAQRDESTVPSQALFLMNNTWVIEQSQLAARRLLAEASMDDADRIHLLFFRAFARKATDDELSAATEYLQSNRPLLDDAKSKAPATPDQLCEARWSALCQTIFASAEFRTLR